MIKAKKETQECCMYSCKKKLTEENKAKGVTISICKDCLCSLQNDNS